MICFIISPQLPRTHNFLYTPLTLFNYSRVNQTLYKPRENEITTGRPDRGVRTQARHRQDWPSGRKGRTCAPRSKGRSVIANRYLQTVEVAARNIICASNFGFGLNDLFRHSFSRILLRSHSLGQSRLQDCSHL